MLECRIEEHAGLKWVLARGRIDSITCFTLQERIDELIEAGERRFVVGMEEAHYISSAGLRIFLTAQKQLRKVGGEVILFGVQDQVWRVFKMSALDGLFRVAGSFEELTDPSPPSRVSAVPLRSVETHGMLLTVLDVAGATAGVLEIIGSQEPFSRSAYTEKDVVNVQFDRTTFGVGLGALGELYDEYKGLFGESIVCNGSFFSYPAVPRSAVDFLLNETAGGEAAFHYKFFHGFSFKGAFCHILAFEGTEGPVSLGELVRAAIEVSQAGRVGLVFIAESKGIWGMNLKRAPILENCPRDEDEIFAPAHFSEWMNFPVEPEMINHIVIGVGLAVRSPESETPDVRALLPEGHSFHVHGVVFSRGTISREVTRFERELRRVPAEFDALKVQHLLGRSLFQAGMLGIIDLQE